MLSKNAPKAATSQNQQQQQQQQPINVSLPALDTDPVDEDKRKNALDIVRENLERQGKSSVTYQIVVCGTLGKSADNKYDIGARYQELFKQQITQGELITGGLFIFSNTLLHYLEVSDRFAIRFLRELQAHTSDFLSTSSLKVLVLNDDIPVRKFPFWTLKVFENHQLQQDMEIDRDLLNEENLPKTITELCLNLMKLGNNISNNSNKNALEDIFVKNIGLLPTNAMLTALVECSDVMGIEEWLQVFDERPEFVLESEMVWPCPKLLSV